MKLGEILKNYYGKNVKIGMKDGSAYIYCDVCSEDTIKELDDMSDRTILDYQKQIKRKQRYLNFDNLLRNERIVQTRLLKEYKEKLRTYQRLLDREVFEVYKTIDCPDLNTPMLDIIAIIVEGSESGAYWTMNEYKNRFTIEG
jgi:hypothetical protein